MTWLGANKERALFVSSTVLLLAGGAAWLLSASTLATVLWIVGTALGLVFSVGWMVGAIRRGQLSVDVIAVLALAGAGPSARAGPSIASCVTAAALVGIDVKRGPSATVPGALRTGRSSEASTP